MNIPKEYISGTSESFDACPAGADVDCAHGYSRHISALKIVTRSNVLNRIRNFTKYM